MRRLAWLISRVFPRGFRLNPERRVVLGRLRYSCVDAETIDGKAAHAFHDIANTMLDRSGMDYCNAMTTSGKLKRGPCNWRPARGRIDREKVIGTVRPLDHSITLHSSSCAFRFRHDRFNDAHDLLTGDFHVRLEQLGTEFYITFAAGINDRHVFCM